MHEASSIAETVFNRAVHLAPGPGREQFLADHCGDDPVLREAVESLLRAHDEAGSFLEAGAPRVDWVDEVHAAAGTAALSAAAHANLFLRSGGRDSELAAETYVASLPTDLRQETRERILAGLRVRRLPPSQQSPSRVEDEPVPRLPGFRVERKLGEGGLAVVYAAQDEKLHRSVAIKVLRRRADGQVRARVLEEARKAAALGDAAVVTVYSVLDESDPPAIVMELVEGYPMDRAAEHLSFDQKARLLREVARGLAVAHRRGLVHRDLKPDNILVGPELRPRILDFGLALSLEEAGRLGGGFEGTPLYASPEQALGQALTAASDAFSFGSLMFKVLTGRPPFPGRNIYEVLNSIVTTAPPFLREVAAGVPEDLQAICLACLSWNPQDRPTADELVQDLGRFLVGEPARLRPTLYDDLLRRNVSEHSNQVRTWANQNIISREERDSLEVMHRRLLAEEDHWIIDARRVTPLQTVLSVSTWLGVVATVLLVWMVRDELDAPWRWLLPALFTSVLLIAGDVARRERETAAAATFLAGAALAVAPCCLALLAEFRLLGAAPEGVTQLFGEAFTNAQVLASSMTALVVSGFALWRLAMTGFAWTTAALMTASYLSVLLLFNWLEKSPDTQALWCLPLVSLEVAALRLERLNRVRWTLPFHLVALVALVGCLDVMALHGPTLQLLGLDGARWAYFDTDRLTAYSFALNGGLFLALMLMTERSSSLDLRRASKLLEVLAILHLLSALFTNALNHRTDPLVRVDVWLYLATAVFLAGLAPFGSRWRLLVGGLAGCGLGCYLLVDLNLVARKPFIIGLGVLGVAVATITYVIVRQQRVSKRRR